VLSRLDGRAAYAFADGGAAVGLGVAEGELCALFCVATRPERRRRGLAAAVVGALGAWGRTRGARTVALEVEEGNAPALALYARLGFERRYAYVNRALMKSRYQSPERLTVRRCVA
jgi:ribosomal protein S18 acetylase RimI-like enzyme